MGEWIQPKLNREETQMTVTWCLSVGLGLLTSPPCRNYAVTAHPRQVAYPMTWGAGMCQTVWWSLPPLTLGFGFLERPQTLSLLAVILITPVMIHYIIYSPKLNHSISHFLPCRHLLLYFTHGFQMVFIVAFKSYFSTVPFKTSHFIFWSQLPSYLFSCKFSVTAASCHWIKFV